MSSDNKKAPAGQKQQQPSAGRKKDEIDEALLNKVSGGGTGGTINPKPPVAL